MPIDVSKHCQQFTTCRQSKVSGLHLFQFPLVNLGVDVLQVPMSSNGNLYTVFIGCTRLFQADAFPMPDQCITLVLARVLEWGYQV